MKNNKYTWSWFWLCYRTDPNGQYWIWPTTNDRAAWSHGSFVRSVCDECHCQRRCIFSLLTTYSWENSALVYAFLEFNFSHWKKFNKFAYYVCFTVCFQLCFPLINIWRSRKCKQLSIKHIYHLIEVTEPTFTFINFMEESVEPREMELY